MKKLTQTERAQIYATLLNILIRHGGRMGKELYKDLTTSIDTLYASLPKDMKENK